MECALREVRDERTPAPGLHQSRRAGVGSVPNYGVAPAI
jgi:hypothetical protein